MTRRTELPFDIRNFLDYLTPANGKNRYLCPVCNGNNLTIAPDTGKYQCWNGCDCRDIREAISPWEKHHIAKSVRSKADRTWTYTDVHGNKLLRTRRIDDGMGKRKLWQECNVNGIWVSGKKVPEDIKQRAKAAITPYRYTEVKAAVSNGETIYWVEGEPCVDLLWKLGIPATTTIGGSNSYDKFGNYAELLKGAKIVLCPDQDIPGSEYMDKIFADFPDAQWLYVFHESPLWSDLPKDKGLDIADWLESGATKEQILAAVKPERNLSKTQRPDLTNALVRAISIEELQTEITALCNNEILIDSALVAKILSLAERSGRSTRDIWSLYNAHQRDLTKVDESSNVDELLMLQQKTLTARGIFHPSLETLIEQTVIAMPTCEAWLITTLLPALDSSIGAKSRIVIKASSAYILIPIFWTAIVSKTGRKKTPTQYQIIHPLTELEAEAYKVWKEDNDRYKKEVSAQRRNSELSEPCEPSPRKRYITNSLTPEGLTRVLADIGVSSSGLLRYTDEILALFQFNQYKNKGDEEQFYLSLFNGSSIISDRVDIDRSVVVERSCVSITGSIQWEILERLQAKLGFEDSSGIMARFLFSAEDAPPGYLDLENDDKSSAQLSGFLKTLYQSLRQLPERDYLLSPEAKRLFQVWQHELTDCSISETHAGQAAVYPKIETYTGRFALLLHCVNATLQQKLPAPTVSDATMQRAITLAKYYLSQARLVYGTNDPASLSDKILMQIITLSKKKGWINSRIAKQSIRVLKSYTSDHIRKLFQNLVEMDHGSIEGSGTQMKWHYSASTPEGSESKRSQNLEKASVDNSSNFVDATPSTATITARSHVPAPVTQLVDNVDTLFSTDQARIPTKRNGLKAGNLPNNSAVQKKAVVQNISNLDLSDWEEIEHG